jgi:hypothetical protein
MSYLIDDEKVTPPVKKRDHRGKLNPHYNCPMSNDSKKRISSSQSLRYSAIRQLLTQKPLTEERVREIIAETITEYISKNTTEVKNNNRPNNIPL